MLKENTTLKRGDRPAILSREHEEGLLFCWKIRQGLGNGTAASVLRDFTLWHWHHQMKADFHQEERILLPYICSHPFAGQLKKEHDDIRDLVLALDKAPDTNLFSILASFISNHIRFEERHLFSYLEKVLSEDQLSTVAGELRGVAVSDKKWNTPFWSKK